MSENAIRLLTTKKIIMAEEGTEWETVILHAYSTHSVITSELVILEDISGFSIVMKDRISFTLICLRKLEFEI